MKWIHIKDTVPVIKDLPFVTIDKFGNIELWEDSDWFDEIVPENRIEEYVKFLPIKE